ncbi:MAG: bacillithiol system redox-active protein YtxJ [Verrucomicrobia bacterium]|nr:bacillithiol system redox-active protein YtxJ [Cytophagales bacterium]
MNWIPLNTLQQLEKIQEISETQPVLLFKHSTTCPISATALNRLERNWKTDTIQPYYLDLLSYRDISRQIAQVFGIQHESPQALLIYKGTCVFDASHLAISYQSLLAEANKLSEKV